MSSMVWSWRKWAGWTSVVFLAHLGLIYYLGGKGWEASPLGSGFLGIHLPERMEWSDLRERFPAAIDPAFAALPSLEGFSGDAWLRFSAKRFEPSAWQDTPRPLPPDPEPLGLPWLDQQIPVPVPRRVAELPLPQRSWADAGVGDRRFPESSSFVLGEDFRGRRLLSAPALLPSWPHTEPLNATSVQYWVDSQGRVLSAVVLSSSGLQAADQWAVNASAELRFEPLQPSSGLGDDPGVGPLSRGTVSFRWKTLAPSEP